MIFIDELSTVAADSDLTFGREADLVIDESNPFMHRRVGRFLSHQGLWWLRNEGRRTELTIVRDSGALTTLPPGDASALSGEGGAVRFDAGASSYELHYVLERSPELPMSATAEVPSAQATRDFAIISLNDEQRLLLAALCERRLADPHADRTELPPNADVAHQLGWSIKKFDRKLDYVCSRLADEGVRGLRGGKGIEAFDRRANLVDHALASGLISAPDLDALREHRLRKG